MGAPRTTSSPGLTKICAIRPVASGSIFTESPARTTPMKLSSFGGSNSLEVRGGASAAGVGFAGGFAAFRTFKAIIAAVKATTNSANANLILAPRAYLCPKSQSIMLARERWIGPAEGRSLCPLPARRIAHCDLHPCSDLLAIAGSGFDRGSSNWQATCARLFSRGIGGARAV